MSFTTANKIKLHLWGNTTSTQYDSLWTQLLLMIDDYITQETGVALAASTITTFTNEILDSNGTDRLRVKHHPIGTITTVQRRDANDEWETYSGVYEDIATGEIEAGDYIIHSKYVIAPKGERKVRVTYTAGYIDSTVPDDLALAATLIAVATFNRRDMEGLKSQNLGDLAISIGDEIPILARKILKRYKPIYAL